MTKCKHTKRALLVSVLSMLLCLSMLVGSTFAWFTDSVVSGKNKIVAGNLDVELLAKQVGGTYVPVAGDTNLFKEDTLWEPGHVEVVNLKVDNLGTLALKYKLGINVASETPGTNVYGDEFKLSQFIKFAVIDGEQTYEGDEGRQQAIEDAEANDPIKLSEVYKDDGVLYPDGTEGEDKPSESFVTLVVYMPTNVGNEANYKTGTAVPEIFLGVNLVATQTPYEQDSFDDQYDEPAPFPATAATPEELEEAVANAKDGDVIELTADIKLKEELTINKDITISGNGMKIENMPVSVGANNTVTFRNVNFANTTGKPNASSVYATGLTGGMIFDGCTFGNSNRDSIQVTPAGDATITIKNCSFTATKDMKRFIDLGILDNNNNQLNITIENCKFAGCDKVKSAETDMVGGTVIGLGRVASGSTMTLGGCTFTDSNGSTAANVIADIFNSEGDRTYSVEEMRTMLTGNVTTYTVE